MENIKQQRLDQIDVIDGIKEKLEKATAFYVAQYDGIDVENITKLRKDLRAVNCEFKVLKNTMVKLALKGSETASDFDSLLVGPNAITFAYEDPAAAARVLFDCAKTNKTLQIKGCLFENQFFGPDKISVIKDLPSREALLSMLANVLNEPMAKLARTLDALREKNENQ